MLFSRRRRCRLPPTHPLTCPPAGGGGPSQPAVHACSVRHRRSRFATPPPTPAPSGASVCGGALLLTTGALTRPVIHGAARVVRRPPGLDVREVEVSGAERVEVVLAHEGPLGDRDPRNVQVGHHLSPQGGGGGGAAHGCCQGGHARRHGAGRSRRSCRATHAPPARHKRRRARGGGAALASSRPAARSGSAAGGGRRGAPRPPFARAFATIIDWWGTLL